MPTYYDVIGVAPDAPVEEIARGCDRVQAQLEKSGQIEPYQSQLRKVRETLLNPDLRQNYNQKMGLLKGGAPPRAASAPPKKTAPAKSAARLRGIRPPLLIGAIVVVALCAVYLLWHFVLGVPTPPDTGRYLLPPNGGQPVAVVIAHDPNHLFEGNSSPSPAVLIYKLADGNASWLGDSVVGLVYRVGGPAPGDLVEKARQAVKAQQNQP